MTQALHELTVAEAGTLFRSRKLSPVELTQTRLDRIDAIDGALNSVITVFFGAKTLSPTSRFTMSGRPGKHALVLRLGHAFERETHYRGRRPSLEHLAQAIAAQ